MAFSSKRLALKYGMANITEELSQDIMKSIEQPDDPKSKEFTTNLKAAKVALETLYNNSSMPD